MKRIIIIGAGHAGIEAAYAISKMGLEAILVTIHLETIAQMSCNPSIGGIAKGHLVKEIDALGGIMPNAADFTCIHFKTLNSSKGLAVRATRTQNDKTLYRNYLKSFLEEQPNIKIYQSIVTGLDIKKNKIIGIHLLEGNTLEADAAIICSGTFLAGKIYIGKTVYDAGRANEPASIKLAKDIKNHGFKIIRLKTGTPMRIHKDSIQWEKFIRQKGDEPTFPFSVFTNFKLKNQIDCYIGHTNKKVKDIINRDLHYSPLYSGKIQGIGPRYCPSIEDKINKFPHREEHQFYLEQEGLNNKEIYLSGLSSSLPVTTQKDILNAIPGLKNCVMMRPAYAVEYDAIASTQLKATLESKDIENLYFAGQLNGTSGYEEAAAQGLMAGINSVLKLKGQEPFILNRSEAYIGVLIDDLIKKGVDEPYRLFTSRAEFRLKLREDNAFERLGQYGFKYKLINKKEFDRIQKRFELRKTIINNLKNNKISFEDKVETLHHFLKRPQINIKKLSKILSSQQSSYSLPPLSEQDITYIEATIKYEGYIKVQEQRVLKKEKLKKLKIPQEIDYFKVHGLSTEIREKLTLQKPKDLFEASQIPGVTPASINALIIYLKIQARKGN